MRRGSGIERSRGKAGPARRAIGLWVGLWSLMVVSGLGAATDEDRWTSDLWAGMAASCGTGSLGDVTGDDAVNIIDAQQIARWSVGLNVSATVSGRIPSHGDITGDGNVNIIDAQQIARWAVGLSSPFPVGEALPACEGLRVTATTTGQSLDPDGYSVFLDGGFVSNIGVNGIIDIPSATPGAHTVLLQGLAANCSITNGSASRSVTVVEGEAASVDYEVACEGTGQGTLEVRNTTTCSSSPAGGYSVTLDGSAVQSMPAGGTVVFNGVSFGSHQVTLGNVPGGCTVQGGGTLNVTVAEGLNIVHFVIE